MIQNRLGGLLLGICLLAILFALGWLFAGGPASSDPAAMPTAQSPLPLPANGDDEADQLLAGGEDLRTRTSERPSRLPEAAEPTNPSTGDMISTAMRFVDVTDTSGIEFLHTDGASGRHYIVETVVAGLATFDYDGDGWIDIYLLNGAALPGATVTDRPRNALYRNNGDWTFTDVTDQAGVGDEGYGLGVVAADYDGDGDQDLFVNNFGPNVLYENNGDGTFRILPETAGLDAGDAVGAGASFLDIEADGDLDLYAANYVDFTFENHVTRRIGSYEFPAAPGSYEPEPDILWRNNGDGTFVDISETSGIQSAVTRSMGIVSGDFDADGDADVYVCGDNSPNLLFQNDGNGHFQEVGLITGVAHDLAGNNNGSMGVDCGDYNNDGLLDLFVTNYQGELAVLYRNVGGGFFGDVSRATGVGASTYPHVKWGTTLADFDHDGDRDVFIACGHFLANIRKLDDRTDVRVPNALLQNQGDGTFVDVSRQSGSGLAIAESSKGAAFDDLDNDGDLDAVILNVNARPSILRNESAHSAGSLQIRLRGTLANRDGVGARVTVRAGELVQTAEVHSGRGYQSHYGIQLHFGLGTAAKADTIEIRWPGGDQDVIESVPDGRTLLITQGAGAVKMTR